MFVLTEKTAPIRRPQTLNGNNAEDPDRAKRQEDERWAVLRTAAIANKAEGSRYPPPSAHLAYDDLECFITKGAR